MFRKNIYSFLALLLIPVAAGAEIVVVASPELAVTSLSKDEVRQLFTGRTTRLGGQRVRLLDLPAEHPARERFYQAIVGKTLSQMQSHWARQVFTGHGEPPSGTDGPEEVQARASKSPGYIGYLPADEVNEDALRVLYRVD